MKNLNSIVSESGILKSHEEFMDKLNVLMKEYGFTSLHADAQRVVFENGDAATEGLSFSNVKQGVYMNVDSFFSHHGTAVQYGDVSADSPSGEVSDEANQKSADSVAETPPVKFHVPESDKPKRAWGAVRQ